MGLSELGVDLDGTAEVFDGEFRAVVFCEEVSEVVVCFVETGACFDSAAVVMDCLAGLSFSSEVYGEHGVYGCGVGSEFEHLSAE